MRKLLNTLYITSEDAYLALKGETIEVCFSNGEKKNIPLINIESIICFSYKGASPALMGKCAENGIGMSFFTPNNRFLASVGNFTNGNILLRKRQYEISTDLGESLSVAKNFIHGKLYNSKFVIHRTIRDHPMQVDKDKLLKIFNKFTGYIEDCRQVSSIDELRGVEGYAAAEYFSVFNEHILQNKNDFCFSGRTKRPPQDMVNTLLSFAYSLLANECSSALQGVGLDPYMGFMHTIRPGRKSLALDIEEELRSVFADRFVITLINNRIITASDFNQQDNGAVLLKEDGRRKFITEWQKRKKEQIEHPFLHEKIEWGLVPHVQASLLARFIRGDIDGYPPFFWK